MRKILLVATMSLMLGACNTTGINQALDKVNSEIAKAGETIQKLCPTARNVLSAAQLLDTVNKQTAYAQTKAAVESMCASPVTDVVSAALALEAAYKAAKSARLNGV